MLVGVQREEQEQDAEAVIEQAEDVDAVEALGENEQWEDIRRNLKLEKLGKRGEER